MEFFHTLMGQRFFESTLPNLVTQLARIANALDRLLDRIEHGERARTQVAAEPPTENAP